MGLLLLLKVSPILAGIPGFEDDESVLSLTTAFAANGLLLGLAQWAFLWRKFTRAWVWPLCSAAGLGLGLGLVLATGLVDRSGLVSFLLAAFIYAFATGLVIAWQPAWSRKTD